MYVDLKDTAIPIANVKLDDPAPRQRALGLLYGLCERIENIQGNKHCSRIRMPETTMQNGTIGLPRLGKAWVYLFMDHDRAGGRTSACREEVSVGSMY